jgi:hypothetical protein
MPKKTPTMPLLSELTNALRQSKQPAPGHRRPFQGDDLSDLRFLLSNPSRRETRRHVTLPKLKFLDEDG